MTACAPRPVRVLICGQADRGDDGVGEAAVARLPASVLEVADVRHCGQLGIDDLLDIPPGEPCIIVDAALGPPPGGLVVLPLARVAARAGADAIAPRSSHQLPIDQVLRLVEVLRGEVPQGTFIGLGGLRFGLGRGLSHPVRLALPGLAAALGAEISRLAATPRC